MEFFSLYRELPFLNHVLKTAQSPFYFLIYFLTSYNEFIAHTDPIITAGADLLINRLLVRFRGHCNVKNFFGGQIRRSCLNENTDISNDQVDIMNS
jgi:hypothetical protein